ncbi:hypothetical protein BO70DRAFT_384399 [Aspergillus heteromorphus CBS 117.55]|uniref:Uncharacterized protein n=1 Tax=Aspergillus heteromorphus CBS 117.55 TaxID=1448321 RepID=A0A317WXY6_9EURO|nr:uncharacterized protein BO70DRAFT_384399 [Aspergillus heteromorphus CBS 117.55]PWY90771.1 hypothetical protein BO70DRAFT_384399 [Aspergillus heteromorphus CBS 117.55]
MSRAGQRAPSKPHDWAQWAAKEGITDQSIHDERLVSASKFQARHFLLLRVLWTQWLQPAKEMLRGYNSWKAYLDSFDVDIDHIGEGNFFSAKRSQFKADHVSNTQETSDVIVSPVSKHTCPRARQRREELASTPSKTTQAAMESLILGDDDPSDIDPFTPEGIFEDSASDSSPLLSIGSRGPPELWKDRYPDAEDDFPSVSSKWTSHRKAFKPRFTNTQYEARTDGYLRGKAGDNSLGVRMQESAQMVAWIKLNPHTPGNLPHRYVHVSQNRHEIWLIFAEYNGKYLDYLEGKCKATDPLSFLTMHEVGPFDTMKKPHMDHLGLIVLALVLRADHDREEELRTQGR